MTEDKEKQTNFRAPQSLIKRFDDTWKAENKVKTRADKLRELVEDFIAKNSGVQPQQRFNYEGESDKLDALKSKRSRLGKILMEARGRNGFTCRRPLYEAMLDFSLLLKLDLTPHSTIPEKYRKVNVFEEPHTSALLKKLYGYKRQPDDPFNSYDLDDWIKYIELTVEINRLRKELIGYRAKKVTEEQIATSFADRVNSTTENIEQEVESQEETVKEDAVSQPVEEQAETQQESEDVKNSQQEEDTETDSSDDENDSENEDNSEEF